MSPPKKENEGKMAVTQTTVTKTEVTKPLEVNKPIEQTEPEVEEFDMKEAIEKVAGPNPAPNREGNEISKATHKILSMGFVPNPEVIADQIKEMLEKGTFDKDKLAEIEKKLRTTTKVA